jgi:non-ribosomal peptide synthetase component F
MAGAPPTFLPYDTDPGSAVIGPLEYLPFEIPTDCRDRLARLASDLKVTLFLVVLAAHFITLARLLGQSDLVLTVITSGREHPALADFVGNAADCLPIRMSVHPELALTEFIAQLQANYLLAYRHQVKWELLLQALGGIGASCTSPLTNLIAAEQTGVAQAPVRHGARDIAIEDVPVAKPQSVGSVAWHVTHDINMCDCGQDIRGVVKYLTLRYSRQTIQHFLDCFLRCVDAIARDRDRAIGEVAVAS